MMMTSWVTALKKDELGALCVPVLHYNGVPVPPQARLLCHQVYTVRMVVFFSYKHQEVYRSNSLEGPVHEPAPVSTPPHPHCRQ